MAEVGATGLAEIGVVGITMSAAILGFSGISVVKEMNIKDNQRIASGSYVKKKLMREKRRSNKGKRHILMASVSCSPPSSSSKLETFFFTMGSSSSSLRTSSIPSSEDKSALGPQVVELGIKEGVITKEEPSFMD